MDMVYDDEQEENELLKEFEARKEEYMELFLEMAL